MSRSGYSDDCDDYGLWRGTVKNAIKGKRGQKFLRELAEAMDAMPEKVLISEELISAEGDCCAIGVVCKARGLDVKGVDVKDRESVANLVGIAPALAAEIAFLNDDDFAYGRPSETPEARWTRMRQWVSEHITEAT